MKMKFNIRTVEGLVEVKGEFIPNTLDMKMFVHKAHDCNNFVVSEFYTGMVLSRDVIKKQAIQIALERERNADYWDDVIERIEYNRAMIEDNIAIRGYANQD